MNKGPVDDSHRSCRDIICCIIFVAFIGGMIVVTGLGFSKGNPNLVLYPYDDDGRQCGFQNMKDYPYLYFYQAVSNLKTINTTGVVQGVCVSSCPGNYTASLNCSKTKANPNCSVKQIDYYVSTPCKLISYFISFRKILYSRSSLYKYNSTQNLYRR